MLLLTYVAPAGLWHDGFGCWGGMSTPIDGQFFTSRPAAKEACAAACTAQGVPSALCVGGCEHLSGNGAMCVECCASATLYAEPMPIYAPMGRRLSELVSYSCFLHASDACSNWQSTERDESRWAFYEPSLAVPALPPPSGPAASEAWFRLTEMGEPAARTVKSCGFEPHAQHMRAPACRAYSPDAPAQPPPVAVVDKNDSNVHRASLSRTQTARCMAAP